MTLLFFELIAKLDMYKKKKRANNQLSNKEITHQH